MTESALSTDLNSWDIWLSLVAAGGSPARDSDVSTGYWRLPNGMAGTAIPVATWNDSGMWLATIKDRTIDADSGEEWLTFVAQRWPKLCAVTQEDYDHAVEHGEWPDGTLVEKRDGIGGNSPPEEETLAPEERQARALAKLEAEAMEWLKSVGWTPEAKNWVPPDQAAADRTVVFRDRFQEIESGATALRLAESDPLHKAWKASIEKWKPVIDGAKQLKDQIYGMGQAFLRAENLRRQEEARRENERRTAEAAEAAATAAKSGEAAPPPPAPVVAAAPASIGATRQMTQHKTGPVIEIVNLEAWAGYLGGIDAAGLRALCEKLANQMAKVGVPHMPGVLVNGQPRVEPAPATASEA